jgi:hypothetical protein
MMTSTCALHVTDRTGLCRGLSSGPEGRTELRRKRDEILLPMLGLLWLLGLVGVRGFGGICRNHDTGSILCCFVER